MQYQPVKSYNSEETATPRGGKGGRERGDRGDRDQRGKGGYYQ